VTNRRSFLFVTAAIASVLSTMPHSAAQEAFPSRGVRLIVPFAAGSILDTLARVVADGLSKKLG
jgi:tripartite-type tricarboxylate transporter receptor subunit TctC